MCTWIRHWRGSPIAASLDNLICQGAVFGRARAPQSYFPASPEPRARPSLSGHWLRKKLPRWAHQHGLPVASRGGPLLGHQSRAPIRVRHLAGDLQRALSGAFFNFRNDRHSARVPQGAAGGWNFAHRSAGCGALHVGLLQADRRRYRRPLPVPARPRSRRSRLAHSERQPRLLPGPRFPAGPSGDV